MSVAVVFGVYAEDTGNFFEPARPAQNPSSQGTLF